MPPVWEVEIPDTSGDGGGEAPDTVGRGLHVFDFRFTAASRENDADSAHLAGSELARAERFQQRIDRNRFVIGRSMLRQVLGRILEVSPAEVEIGVERGRPFLAQTPSRPLHFNLSHSGDHVMMILSREHPVGIDVELQREFPERDRVAGRVMTREEYEQYMGMDPTLRNDAFYRLWVRKESILKCMGTGFAVEPGRVTVGHERSCATEGEFEGSRFQLSHYRADGCGVSHAWAFACAVQPAVLTPRRHKVTARFR